MQMLLYHAIVCSLVRQIWSNFNSKLANKLNPDVLILLSEWATNQQN